MRHKFARLPPADPGTAGGRRKCLDEVEHPKTIVISSGLTASTPLNLFVLPALYLRFGRGMKALS